MARQRESVLSSLLGSSTSRHGRNALGFQQQACRREDPKTKQAGRRARKSRARVKRSFGTKSPRPGRFLRARPNARVSRSPRGGSSGSATRLLPRLKADASHTPYRARDRWQGAPSSHAQPPDERRKRGPLLDNPRLTPRQFLAKNSDHARPSPLIA